MQKIKEKKKKGLKLIPQRKALQAWFFTVPLSQLYSQTNKKVISRAVQGPAGTDPPAAPDRTRPVADRTNCSGCQRRISFSKTRDQRVGDWISSSQIQETQSDRPIIFSTSFEIFLGRSGKFWVFFGKI